MSKLNHYKLRAECLADVMVVFNRKTNGMKEILEKTSLLNLLRWIQIGPGSIPKKELPLLIGLDPLLDSYITGRLKE